jgi:hypothetical protein
MAQYSVPMDSLWTLICNTGSSFYFPWLNSHRNLSSTSSFKISLRNAVKNDEKTSSGEISFFSPEILIKNCFALFPREAKAELKFEALKTF